ncbi:F-actin-capping protein subunit alpha, partial [Cichlidogyrus casuarinus]
METLTNLLERLETIADNLEIVASQKEEVKEEINYEMTAPVMDFDAIINGPFAEYMTISSKIGGDVDAQAKLVNNCFNAVRGIILVAASSQAPSDAVFQDAIKPCSTAITSVINFKDSKRSSKEFNNLSAVAESISALGWIAVKPTPGPYVKDMSDSGQFYINRVLKDFKDKDQKQVDWCKAWANIWKEMQAYIKEHHTTGLTWNPNGKAFAGASAAAPGGPPPPPPPPPPAMLDSSEND